MSLIIFTKSPKTIFSREYLKLFARKIFNKKRGPQAVTNSLIRGLQKLNYPYKINPPINTIEQNDIIWINESIDALKFAIKFKREGHRNKLIVGPNLVISPDENNSIIFSPEIDIILQPSRWTKMLYEKHNSTASSKIHIWPAGVEDPYENIPTPAKEKYFILYDKKAPSDIFETTICALKKNNIETRILKYGSFKHEEYTDLLDKASGMIYLSPSESQGIALQEAWIRNVPTLVWDRGFWEHRGQRLEYSQVSCPYLNKDSGLTFNNSNDFSSKLEEFLLKLNTFNARDYCINNLTDKITTLRYLDIIKNK